MFLCLVLFNLSYFIYFTYNQSKQKNLLKKTSLLSYIKEDINIKNMTNLSFLSKNNIEYIKKYNYYIKTNSVDNDVIFDKLNNDINFNKYVLVGALNNEFYIYIDRTKLSNKYLKIYIKNILKKKYIYSLKEFNSENKFVTNVYKFFGDNYINNIYLNFFNLNSEKNICPDSFILKNGFCTKKLKSNLNKIIELPSIEVVSDKEKDKDKDKSDNLNIFQRDLIIKKIYNQFESTLNSNNNFQNMSYILYYNIFKIIFNPFIFIFFILSGLILYFITMNIKVLFTSIFVGLSFYIFPPYIFYIIILG